MNWVPYIVVSLAFMGLLLLGEAVARIAGFGDPPIAVLDQEIEYYLVPSSEYRRFGKTYRVNSHSMRSDEISMDFRDRDSATFAILGDSVVYGSGLDQNATIARNLQNLIVAGRRDGSASAVDRPQVLSIAASSWGPENMLAFYRRFGPFPGNTVWVVQSSHDMTDIIASPNDPVPYWTYRPRGALHDALFSVTRRFVGPLLAPPQETVPEEIKRARTKAALTALISKLKLNYARVVLIFHATRDEVLRNVPSGESHFRTLAEGMGIDFISTLEPYRRAYELAAAPHSDEIHPSESGALLVARLLYSTLIPDNSKKSP